MVWLKWNYEDGSIYPEKGELLFTGVTVNPGTGQVQLRATFPNPDHILLPGLYVHVRIARAAVDEAIFVPNQAIQRTAEGVNKVVIINDENMVVDRNVVLGQEFDGRTQVTSGVEVGEKVVVEGFTKIRAGQTVKPQAYKEKQTASEEPVSGSEAPAATTEQ